LREYEVTSRILASGPSIKLTCMYLSGPMHTSVQLPRGKTSYPLVCQVSCFVRLWLLSSCFEDVPVHENFYTCYMLTTASYTSSLHH
jgi:hypothetical protein